MKPLSDHDLNKAIEKAAVGGMQWRALHDEAWRRMLRVIYPEFTEEAEQYARSRTR